jgi:signal transduction histidine kinase
MAKPAESEFEGGSITALLAGSAPWSAGHISTDSVAALVCLLEILALTASAGTVWFATAQASEALPILPTIVCSVGFAVLLIHPLLRALQLPPLSRSVRFNVLLRGVATSMIVVGALVILPGWFALFVLPFAVAAGADASLTVRDLGWRLRPFRWWRRFLGSAFHLGIVGALLATFVRGRDHRFAGVPIYATTQVALPLALAVAAWLGVVLRRVDSEVESTRMSAADEERRERAHWLHDDVCAQLRLVSLRVQTQDTSPSEVVRMLDDLDHQFRLRQLDELFDLGQLSIADLLQPYIRRAQNAGAAIDAVPTFDEAALILRERPARLFARAAAVFTSNALNIKATHLSYLVETTADTVRLTVSDNGPGFELEDTSHGRGLWSLRHELRPGGIEIAKSHYGGAAVTAEIPIEREDDGTHSAYR